ncbi:MAG: protease family protein [Thermoplasmata archaeon]|jgi:membrane protease YdiL (CAAX protease family)|nr:protease family protein [Thermoplasmata archaeon]
MHWPWTSDGLATALLPALFPRWSFYAVPWLLGAGTAIAARIVGHRWLQAAGIGIMTVPLWQTAWGILDSFGPLLQGGFTFRAFTRHELSSLYLYKLVEDLGYLTLGFILFASDRPRDILRQTPRSLARRLVAAGVPFGQRSELRWSRSPSGVPVLVRGQTLGPRNEGSSLLLGVLVFPVLLVTTIAINLLLSGVDELSQSNEASIYDNMTLYHAVVISLAAGFPEELVYRGLLQTGLSRRMPMGVAVVVQALVFGFAHSGYGTWVHIILPALFGLVAGLVAWRFGMWAAIALHVMVDLFAFGLDASNNVPWLWQAIVWAFLANCALTLGYAALWVVRRIEARRTPPAA